MRASWNDVQEKAQQFKEFEHTYWLNDVLFSPGWWILFITTIVFFIVWIIIVDKKRIFEIVTYGMMVLIIGVMLDTLGLSLSWWDYPITLLYTPQLLEVHSAHMPIFYMITYQYFHKWKSFFIAASILALVFSLIFEPILVWMGIYKLHTWRHIYGLIPYFVIAVVLKWIINKLKQLDQNYQ